MWHLQRVTNVMMKICVPDPRKTESSMPLRGGRNTSPCTSFQPNSSWASSWYHTHTHTNGRCLSKGFLFLAWFTNRDGKKKKKKTHTRCLLNKCKVCVCVRKQTDCPVEPSNLIAALTCFISFIPRAMCHHVNAHIIIWHMNFSSVSTL